MKRCPKNSGMVKRSMIAAMFVLCSVATTGCVNKLNLSDENTEILSNYMSSTVVKHQKNSDYKLISTKAPDDSSAKPENTNEPESSTSPVKSDKPQTTNKPSTMEPQSPVKTVEPVKKLSLEEVIGAKNCSIKPVGYKEMSRYSEGKYYSFEPDEGKKIIKVTFDVKNTSDKKINVKINALGGIKYKLIVNEKEYLPLMTAADNDIMFLDMSLKSGGKKQGVLFYQIDKKITISSMKLITSTDKGSAEVSIK